MLDDQIAEFEVPEDVVGDAIRKAVAAQEDIGWAHMLKGRISKKWKRMQCLYYATRYPGKKTMNHER